MISNPTKQGCPAPDSACLNQTRLPRPRFRLPDDIEHNPTKLPRFPIPVGVRSVGVIIHQSWILGPSTVHALCFGSPTSTWVVDLRLAWFLMDLGVVNRGACVVLGNNGGLRGLSWILGSVNRACVVRGLSTGTGVAGLSWEQPRLAWSLMDLGVVNRGTCVVLGNNGGWRGLSWILGSVNRACVVGLSWEQPRLAWSLMDLGGCQPWGLRGLGDNGGCVVSHGSWGPSTVHALCFGFISGSVNRHGGCWSLVGTTEAGVVSHGSRGRQPWGLRGLGEQEARVVSHVLGSVNRACVVRARPWPNSILVMPRLSRCASSSRYLAAT